MVASGELSTARAKSHPPVVAREGPHLGVVDELLGMRFILCSWVGWVTVTRPHSPRDRAGISDLFRVGCSSREDESPPLSAALQAQGARPHPVIASNQRPMGLTRARERAKGRAG
jgi:hypothetical protein